MIWIYRLDRTRLRGINDKMALRCVWNNLKVDCKQALFVYRLVIVWTF